MSQLDELTYNKANFTLKMAQRSGHNPVEALHYAGLLWTPHRERETRANTLKFIVKEMNTWRPAEFMRSVNRSDSSGTPADMQRAIVAWIEKHIKAIEEDQ